MGRYMDTPIEEIERNRRAALAERRRRMEEIRDTMPGIKRDRIRRICESDWVPMKQLAANGITYREVESVVGDIVDRRIGKDPIISYRTRAMP